MTKYLYHSESQLQNFVDISIITTLREKQNEFVLVPHEQKARVAARCITWQETIQVVEMQRDLADRKHRIVKIPNQPEKLRLDKRKPSAIATDFQKALLLLLMVLIPCDRQQTYRRLQFRESWKVEEHTEGAFLLWGDFSDHIFVPKAKMNDSKKAKWWLAVYDFKTIEKYGPFWYPLPNQEFRDGKTFYEYLEIWLFGLEDTEGKWVQYYKGKDANWQGYIDHSGRRHGWRMALQPKCDQVFFGSTSHKPFIKESFTQLIQNIFIRFTPQLERSVTVPVTPNSLRTMFATFTAGKLTSSEEESITYCEHHSLETRRKDYGPACAFEQKVTVLNSGITENLGM